MNEVPQFRPSTMRDEFAHPGRASVAIGVIGGASAQTLSL